MVTSLILGTAGHIDHGKTSLIRALTGVDTDRLPEEKRRGITIDLGFAELDLGDYRLGVVDVPGHERFVRNMLSGAVGMDVALLVVAADDSVKPQTREHLEILRLLDLPAGVIALTKCDLVDPGWLELVEEEVRELVAGTFLARSPCVRTSTVNGSGLDELRQALRAAAGQAAGRAAIRRQGPFCMPVDRSFSIAGHGAVATGSISRGEVALGDLLQLEPAGVEVRVRGLHNHDRPVEQAWCGQRAAINLGGVRHDQIARGQSLAAPGLLAPSRLLTVELAALPQLGKGLKDRSRFRLHLGSGETMVSLRLLAPPDQPDDARQLEPGQRGMAQLHLAEPVAAVWSQPFVLRSESPVHTVGGGRVIDPNAARLRRATPAVWKQLQDLLAGDPLRRAAAAAYLAGLRSWRTTDLVRLAGVDDAEAIAAELLERGELVEIALSPTRRQYVQRDVLADTAERIVAALEASHTHHPLRLSHDRAPLAARFADLEPALLEAVLQQMRQAGRIHLTERTIGLSDRGPKLSANERKLLAAIVQQFREAGIEAPSAAECAEAATRNKQAVPQLIQLAVASGELIEIAPERYLHVEVEAELRQRLQQALQGGPGLPVGEIRQLFGSSRKYVLPYCEYLDRLGVTVRAGDLRQWAETES
ncbi:selenocysteine-specific translation elongation factor [Lignipirellula cremea]|uniref:Selenocysteine-specific elongation factor n=1 Tax=Lignipirellula cremea TaxID=2528010 RepID=A0A518DMH1_9BACT|nr:selenocysteine-specific translation elongation factor [Lignipirellula cremea]QDU93022.1 Selenocysteine-specific elongation factor [Lignipirellula cremea]